MYGNDVLEETSPAHDQSAARDLGLDTGDHLMNRLKIITMAFAAICGAVALLAPPTTVNAQKRAGKQQEQAWRTLRRLVGQWHTSEHGRDTRTDFRLIANGNYLASETVSVSSPEQDIHRDLGVFSYDAGNDRVMMRQFVSEGVICRYKLAEVSSDGKTMTFVTEVCEGGSPDFGARMTYGFPNKYQYTTKLELAPNGKNYLPPCVDNRLERVK